MDRKGIGGPHETITKEIIEKIVTAIAKGNYIETAASYAGIHRATFYRWLRRGRTEQERVAAKKGRRVQNSEVLYVELCDKLDQALAESEVWAVGIIHNAAIEDYKAATWLLTHRFADRWGDKTKVLGSGDNGAIEIDIKKKLVDKLLMIANDKEEEETEEGEE